MPEETPWASLVQPSEKNGGSGTSLKLHALLGELRSADSQSSSQPVISGSSSSSQEGAAGKTWLVQWRKASQHEFLGVSRCHWSMAGLLGSRLSEGLVDANKKKVTRREVGRSSGMETWAFQARLTGVSHAETGRKCHRATPKSKASGSLQLGIWPDIRKRGHCKKSLVGGSGLHFLLEGGYYI